jgi:hypothetical protein
MSDIRRRAEPQASRHTIERIVIVVPIFSIYLHITLQELHSPVADLPCKLQLSSMFESPRQGAARRSTAYPPQMLGKLVFLLPCPCRLHICVIIDSLCEPQSQLGDRLLILQLHLSHV